jgi:hypothetical protein
MESSLTSRSHERDLACNPLSRRGRADGIISASIEGPVSLSNRVRMSGSDPMAALGALQSSRAANLDVSKRPVADLRAHGFGRLSWVQTRHSRSAPRIVSLREKRSFTA